MICLAIDVGRGVAPLEFMDKTLSDKESIALHVAPAQGLFLEMSFFEGYNRRKNTQKNPKNMSVFSARNVLLEVVV